MILNKTRDLENKNSENDMSFSSMPDQHSSSPLEPIDCPFKDAGCTEKIALEDMEDHMATNEQKHVLLTFQSLQQMYQELKHGQQLISKRMDTLEESIRHTDTPKSTAQSPSVMTSILQGSFDEIGDILTIVLVHVSV